MANFNVLISGSGIAGSVFAFWLLRAYPDANITIIERAPSLRLTGASVDIRSNAVDIVNWMGAEADIRKHGTREAGVQFVRKDGSEIATLDATGRTDIQSATSEYEIFRGALAQIFTKPIQDRVKIIFDETVESYEQRGGEVVVTFTNSKEVKTYDILVAADGLGSKIRGTMLGTSPREQVYSDTCHCAYFTIKSDLLDGGKLAKWYNATGGRAIFIRPDPDPAGRTRGNLINVNGPKDVEIKARLEKAMHEGNESYMTLLEELFQDAGWIAQDVLKGMRGSDDFYCSLFAQVRSPKLQTERVVLLGDAGYATQGFGTSLAIIAGYVLAGELLSNPGDVPAALERYEGLMLPFVKSCQFDDTIMQVANPQTQWGIGIRDALLGFVTWSKLDKLMMNAGAVLGFTEKRLKMPDYAWPDIATN